MKKLAAILLLLLVGSTLAFSQAAQKADPNGGNTGGAGDVTAAKAGEPTMAELANAVGHNKVSINMVWTLITGLLYGNSTQIIAQMIGVAANVVYIGVISIIVYKAIDVVIGNRVSAAAEVEGLDIPEMGIPGYVGIAEDVEAEHAALARIAGRPVPAEGR